MLIKTVAFHPIASITWNVHEPQLNDSVIRQYTWIIHDPKYNYSYLFFYLIHFLTWVRKALSSNVICKYKDDSVIKIFFTQYKNLY
jgi:hypothetical protein